METRALAIAFFYAVGTAVGGISGPLLFGRLIGTEDPEYVAIAFLIGAGVMALGGVAELAFGVRAERTDLETIAAPLTAQDAGSGSAAPGAQAEHVEHAEQEAGQKGRRRREAEHLREEAALARARAAEHRATVHELGSGTDARADAARQETEQTLAAIAELHAAELDERATAQEELGAADGAEAHEAGAASLRARAAEERADAHAEQAAALAADGDDDVQGHLARSRASTERSRACEQRALAELALAPGADDDDPGGDDGTRADTAWTRSAMHTAWAEVHDERARGEDAVAAGRGAPDGHDGRILQLERRALAAEQHLQAAEHRAAAEHRRGHREASERAGERQAERTDRERQARELEERLRRRVARRSGTERHGLGRFRPGPGPSLGPTLGGLDVRRTDDESERALDREIDAVARAVAEQGPLQRPEIARAVGARYWGPGRLGAALDAALAEGRVRRVSRRTYAPAEYGDDGDGDG